MKFNILYFSGKELCIGEPSGVVDIAQCHVWIGHFAHNGSPTLTYSHNFIEPCQNSAGGITCTNGHGLYAFWISGLNSGWSISGLI